MRLGLERCVVQFNLRLILVFPLEEYILSVKFKNLQGNQTVF